MGTNLPTARNAPANEAHVIVRYDATLDAEWRIHYDDDGDGTPILVITFGTRHPRDIALMQIRATAAPRYEIPETVTGMTGNTTVRARWQSDFAAAAKRINPEWLVTDEDGWVGIEPGHCTCNADGKQKYHCPVCLYWSLAQLGYARGWLS